MPITNGTEYFSGPYYDPKLNTPELIAQRRSQYEKSGDNLTDRSLKVDPTDPRVQISTKDLPHGITDITPNNGNFELPPWLNNIVGNIGSGLERATTNPQLLPGLAGAWQYYNNADRYGDMGTEIGKNANPFGDRSQYVQGLSDLYNDPSSLENSAAYRFRLAQGLGTLGPQLAKKGGGYSNAASSMIDYAQNAASQEYDREWARRYEAAGGKFDPANASKLQLEAARLESDAKNAALGHLFAPFAPQPGGTTINNNNGGGPGGGVSNPGTIGRNIWDNSTGNLGSSGSWITSGANIGKYMLKDGTVVDVEKLSDAARNGDPDAIQWLTRISGGGTVDEQIRNLGSGWEGGDTGDPYNPDGGGFAPTDPMGPPESMGPPEPEFTDLEDSLRSWFYP